MDDTSVYWTKEGLGQNCYVDGTVMKLPLDGGTATTLASGQMMPGGIAVDAASVYWSNRGHGFLPGVNDGTVMKLTPK